MAVKKKKENEEIIIEGEETTQGKPVAMISGLSTLGTIAEKKTEDELVEYLFGIVLRDRRIFKMPIRVRNGSILYFDEMWILHEDHASSPACRKFAGYSNAFNPTDVSELFDYLVWVNARNSFRVGMTILECMRVYLHTSIPAYRRDLPFIDRLVTKVESPQIIFYDPYNSAEDDEHRERRVLVRLSLSSRIYPSWKDLLYGVKEHKKEINKKVKEKIARDKYLPKQVDLSNLFLIDIQVFRNCTMEYTFGIRGEEERIRSLM